ncbi:chromosomal replication initiator protein [Lachnospiraceae bacterium PF1-21]|uniref:Chromosomal replication initiator protein DnaA n=1 Tax=Ohessyouella blattaphilus TaxID=2949333 RepID=A0ABT1EK94_9FIRM|nr:chromosomal replication initiator protein DnaA [Ohessyouella blattaphilus]MCP1111113.1 chromosomal replication initiator protein DnaA [Ohessyouella blattaphilus]MCR8564507.1 chromosomal replication initiator protein DnaA [Ohessyouella blattaphilus]
MSIVEEKWPEIIEHLRTEHEIMSVSFNTWIKPLTIYNVLEDTIYILVGSNASVEYIEKKYSLPLKVCVAEILNQEYEIVFVSKDDERIKPSETTIEEINYKKQIQSLADKANLKKKYTFDTFVVGKNNEFAHSSSLAVAESPGEVYNPLFLYGGVGLGKTHLMHSIGNFILEKNPDAKVLYVTSEAFTNEVIEALRAGRTSPEETAMSRFREKYRTIDVLLIDDIQFIIGKTSTQEEFFHTFNELYDAEKQIIISSDKPPKEIETLEARLKSRFEMGLIADISSPDYETRMAILKKKIEIDNLERYHIQNDVLSYIASNVKSNIRELEGSLNKLIALYRLGNNEGEIDIELASKALKDYISPENKREVTPELIIDIICEHYNITVENLKSNKRNVEISFPRQIAMYLIREETSMPFKGIGVLLGGKDHSTVKHGADKIAKDLKEDETLRNTIEILLKKIDPS